MDDLDTELARFEAEIAAVDQQVAEEQQASAQTAKLPPPKLAPPSAPLKLAPPKLAPPSAPPPKLAPPSAPPPKLAPPAAPHPMGQTNNQVSATTIQASKCCNEVQGCMAPGMHGHAQMQSHGAPCLRELWHTPGAHDDVRGKGGL
eukprot:gene11538-34250_t